MAAIVRQPRSAGCQWSKHILCLTPDTCGCTCHRREAIERMNRAYEVKPKRFCPCAQHDGRH